LYALRPDIVDTETVDDRITQMIQPMFLLVMVGHAHADSGKTIEYGRLQRREESRQILGWETHDLQAANFACLDGKTVKRVWWNENRPGWSQQDFSPFCQHLSVLAAAQTDWNRSWSCHVDDSTISVLKLHSMVCPVV
jgi:hypothetical protein